MSAFLGMGGYAAYVWSAFAVAAVVLIGLLIASLRRLNEQEALLRALEAKTPPRRRGSEAPR